MAKQLPHAYPRKTAIKPRHVPAPPGLHERGYLVAVNGDCLEPVVHNGEVIAVEPVLPKAGELACFFFKGQDNGSVKRLLNDVSGFPVHPDSTVVQLIRVQQLNPPKCFHCTADQVEAIHRVVQVRRDDQWLSIERLLVGPAPAIPVLIPAGRVG
jgi:phage repressor protein C with HTH and peptisase S24 domain